METKPTITGFKPPIIDEKTWILGDGNIPSDVLQPDGDWSNFLPSEESQIETEKLIETNTCTIFGTSNVLETLMRRKFGGEYDYSDRVLAIASGADFKEQGGADPQLIGETIRKKGLAEQYLLPNFNDTMKSIDDFLTPPPLFQKVLDQAMRWLDSWIFRHDLLSKGQLISKEVIREALRYSPLGCAGFAWIKDENGKFYRPQGVKDTHWFLLYKMDADGTAYIFDSYSPYKKVLRNDFGFYWVKRYYVNRNLTPQQISIFQQIFDAIVKVLKLDLLWLALKKKNNQDPIMETENTPNVPQTPPVKIDEPIIPNNAPEAPKQANLGAFAMAIQNFEGWYSPNLNYPKGSLSFQNNNPGNIKYTSLMVELGAIDKDKNNLCIFESYEKGFSALCQFIKMAGENKLKRFHDCSIKSFFAVYAEANQINYANYVAKQLSVSIETKVAELI